MTVLPIVARELRVTSRKSRTYWSRAGVAALMLLVACWVFLMTLGEPPALQAVLMFGTLAGAMLVVGGFSGVGATADALSSEKRDGTLGLLFLTPLKSHDVVLGKLAAGSLSVLYGLLGVTPLLALPLLMGGLSAGEFVRMALLLLNTLVLSLAVGICVSSVSRDEKRARAATLGLMLLLAAGFPIAGALLEHELGADGALRCSLWFSPGFAFAAAWDKSRSVAVPDFWPSMLVIHGMTWGFLTVAVLLTPRTWQDRPVSHRSRVMTSLRRSWNPTGEHARARRARLLDQSPFGWLAARPQHKPLLVWCGLLGVTVAWIGFGLRYPSDMFNPPMFVIVALTWNGILKFWVASEASRQIAFERRSGSIELLLSTPLTVADITHGSRLALTRQFAAPLGAVVLGEVSLLLLGLADMSRPTDAHLWIAVWIAFVAMLIADVIVLHVVGLWQAAVARSPSHAAGSAVLRILALPWGLYILMLGGLAVAEALNLFDGMPSLGWPFFLGSWVLIGFGVNLAFGLLCRRNLRNRFREAAARPTGPTGWATALGRLFGRLNANPARKP